MPRSLALLPAAFLDQVGIEASLPYVSFDLCLLGSRNPCFSNIQTFFLNLRKIKIILLPDLFFLGVEGGAARLGGVRYNFSLRGMFLLEA